MTSIDLSSEAWRNLVFAHRNRAYGAYRLRETAPMRHRTALFSVLLMVGGASLLSLCLKRDTVRQKVVMVEVTTPSQLEPPVVRQPEMKRVVRSLDPYCDKEAVRVLLSLPRWKPGRQNGKAVSVKYTLPIVFRLQ